MHSVTLGYKVKLFPTTNKSDTLSLLVNIFARFHTECATVLNNGGQCPSTKNRGHFVGRAYRRAFTDWRRAKKSGYRPGKLKAELIDAAQAQVPRKAKGFDLWIMVSGTTLGQGKRTSGFYVPAKKHRGINRTLAIPGAKLNESAEILRKNGKWYALVSVTVPLPEEKPARGWIGCDVGVRRSITCSDGYSGPDLRPILKKQKDRRALDQKQGRDRSYEMSPQRQAQAKEARQLVSRAYQSGRGVALENPDRLQRWKQWSARFFAKRVLMLASLVGVPVRLCDPPYTSLTCSRCGSRDTFRYKTMFRCLKCGNTKNADFNASLNIRHRVSRVSCESHNDLLSLSP